MKENERCMYVSRKFHNLKLVKPEGSKVASKDKLSLWKGTVGLVLDKLELSVQIAIKFLVDIGQKLSL